MSCQGIRSEPRTAILQAVMHRPMRRLISGWACVVVAGCDIAPFSVAGSSADATAPRVVSVSPANLASNTPVSSSIIATFSESIDPATINSQTFTVSGITGTVTYNGSTVTFTPNQSLPANSNFTAVVAGGSSGVKDAAGNPLTANYEWSFSTCGMTSASTYTVSWDAVADARLSGYRVYYGTASPLTRVNAMATQDVASTATSWDLVAASAGLAPCTRVYVAVIALGNDQSESSLSNTDSAIVD